MDNEPNKFKLHPLTAAAAVAVILVSVTGIAAMTGILPNFSKSADPVVAAVPIDVTPDASKSLPAVSTTPVNESMIVPPRSQAVKKPAVRKPVVDANNDVPAPAPVAPQEAAPARRPPCPNCGVVESARIIQQQAPATGFGAAAGALLGGVLGHQVGGGNGKTLATIAGAVGGGFAGNAVEKNAKTSDSVEVIVQMENGTRQRFIMDEQRWRAGDQVQVNNGQLAPRNQ